MRMISFGVFSAAILSLAMVAGCADSDGVADSGRSDDGGQGDGGDGATSGVGGSGASGGSDTGAGGEAPAVCDEATDVFEVEAAPSNVLFLFDRSGSMHLTVDVTSTRWIEAKAGLFQFIDSLPADTNAGIQLFPRGDAPVDCCVITVDNDIDCGACASGELPEPENRCTADAYFDADVDVGPLTASRRNQIKNAVSASDDEFYWGTPMAAALDGAVQSQIAANAAGVSSIVLFTDGNPTSCDTAADPEANDFQRVIDAAAAGLGAANPVRTFVIGVVDGEGGTLGASEENMSLIAQAGGTSRYAGCEANADCAYPVNVGSFGADLQAALDAIALQAFSCTFTLPEVTGGQADLDAVNVTVTDNGVTKTIVKDTSHSNGWDYLPGNDSLQFYGDACETLKADPTIKVEVVVGCKTQGQ